MTPEREAEIRALIAQRSQAHVRELLAAYDQQQVTIAVLRDEVADADEAIARSIEASTGPLLAEIASLRARLASIAALAGASDD